VGVFQHAETVRANQQRPHNPEFIAQLIQLDRVELCKFAIGQGTQFPEAGAPRGGGNMEVCFHVN
jgi:hypothetical protein